MNRKYIYPLVIIIVTVALYYSDDFLGEKNALAPKISNTIENTSEEFTYSFLPTSTTGAIVKHDFFTLSYSEENEQAEWVTYEDRKSTRLNSSHVKSSYAVFCLKEKINNTIAPSYGIVIS